MYYRKATLNEIGEIYERYMVKDFPPAELKPLKAIKYCVEKGWYSVYIACDENGIKGYANIADCGGNIGFLDYFAVVEKYRDKGLGSEFFKQLDTLCENECIILETESIESAKNAQEESVRRRRIDFYKRLGCIDTKCKYVVFGVEYNVLINRNIELDEEFLAKILSAYEYAYAAILRRDDKNYIERIC